MSVFDDGSNASLLQAAVLLFILGASLSVIKAMRAVDQILADIDGYDVEDDAKAFRTHNPWEQP